MSKAQQLAEKLKQYIPNGDGYNSEFAKDLAEAVEYLSQDEQEPVAWMWIEQSTGLVYFENSGDIDHNWIPLYAHPPKRQPLNHDEITAIALEAHRTISPYWVFCRAVEKAHGIGIAND